MTGRRRNVVFGTLLGYASLLISLTRNVLFVPIYLSSIPLAEYGAWLATGGALALLIINDFGLSGVVTQKISKSYGAGDIAALGSLTGSALAIGVMMALLLTAISLACVPLLPGLMTLSAPEKHIVVNCFLIAIGANASGLVGVTATSVIRSLQRATLAGSIVLAADLANLSITLVGLLRGHGLYAIAGGMLARSVIMILGGGAGIAMVNARVGKMQLVFRWQRVQELLGDASRFFLSSIGMKMQSQANVVFVSSILGPSAAAIYSLTVRAHETVLMFVGQINAALVPSMTHLIGSGNLGRFRAVLLRILLSIAAVSGLALSLTIVLNAGFVHLWLSHETFPGQSVSILMGAALFVSSLGYVGYDALVSQGNFNLVSKVFLLSSVLQLLLLSLTLRSGLWCAPAATLISALVWGTLFWTRVAAAIGLTSAEARSLLAQLARITALSALICAVFLFFYPVANSWWELIGEGALALACLVCGYLAFSAPIRDLAREEISMTLRALRSS